MKREELIILNADITRSPFGEAEVYIMEDADRVMDDLESKIKNLEKANAELIKRVQELEDENNELEKKLEGEK